MQNLQPDRLEAETVTLKASGVVRNQKITSAERNMPSLICIIIVNSVCRFCYCSYIYIRNYHMMSRLG